MMKKPAKRSNAIRLIVQIFFFGLIGLIAVNKSLAESGAATIPFLSSASLHALCPFGGVVTLYNLITVGTLIQKIHASAVILLGLVLLITLFFGPVFCGWVCPLGSAQEWVGKLGRKIFRKKYNAVIPGKVDKWLRYLRFAVLLWVVYVTARSATLLFANVDPYNALFTFWSEEAALPAVIILAVTLAASLIMERPWCKYLCPYGALLGLFNKIRLFKIRRVPETCIACNRCTRVCPMNIDVATKEAVTDFQCISCYECTSGRACPVADTVEMAPPARKQKAEGGKKAPRGVPMWLVALVIFAVIFGGIGTTMLTGDWATESSKIPSKYTTGETAGEYNPADIRGSYTFSDVANTFGIDLAVLYDAFGIPAGTDGTALHTKDVEAAYGDAEIGNGSVQVFVALYKNLPIALDDTYLTKRGAEIILEANPNLTQDQKDYLTTHQIDTAAIEPTPESEPAAETDAELSDGIKGTSTFQQALDAGLTQEQIEAIIGGAMPAANMAVRDYCTEHGLSFSEIKTALNDAIAALE